MDKETRDFIESSFEKWTGIVSGEIGTLKMRMDTFEEELHETRSAVLNIESFLKETVEAQGEEIQGVRQRVERIEDHVGLSHSLAA